MYQYKATLLRVVDGDTVDVVIELGFHLRMEAKVRLYGINAPELSTDEGKAAKAKLIELLAQTNSLTLRTIKDRKEKYGRYLGIFVDEDGHEINARMISEGCAVPYIP
jgi:micrococcal nuclease